uniref:Uncharacterized protein n=1 Tax=Plectus sambesii TaxID=2011161 RepID=A0A914X775_9BILA
MIGSLSTDHRASGWVEATVDCDGIPPCFCLVRLASIATGVFGRPAVSRPLSDRARVLDRSRRCRRRRRRLHSLSPSSPSATYVVDRREAITHSRHAYARKTWSDVTLKAVLMRAQGAITVIRLRRLLGLWGSVKAKPRLFVASTDGYLYIYNVEPEGGECALAKQHRFTTSGQPSAAQERHTTGPSSAASAKSTDTRSYAGAVAAPVFVRGTACYLDC